MNLVELLNPLWLCIIDRWKNCWQDVKSLTNGTLMVYSNCTYSFTRVNTVTDSLLLVRCTASTDWTIICLWESEWHNKTKYSQLSANRHSCNRTALLTDTVFNSSFYSQSNSVLREISRQRTALLMDTFYNSWGCLFMKELTLQWKNEDKEITNFKNYCKEQLISLLSKLCHAFTWGGMGGGLKLDILEKITYYSSFS